VPALFPARRISPQTLATTNAENSAPNPTLADRSNYDTIPHMKPSDSKMMLRLIAVFKLLKTTLLIALGIGALKLIHMDVATVMEHFVLRLGLDPGGRYVGSALEKAANLTPDKVESVAIGSFIYAALFLTEGIGLWMLKRWAEWLTVIITSSLLPVEVYEIFRHPSAGKVLVFILNIGIVGYLIYQMRRNTPPA
jgi:uncharacterized membrane protein (DUF2068 family)